MPNKFLKQLLNFIEELFFVKVIKCWILITKYLRYQYGVTLHLQNSNKERLILAKFYTNDAPFIGNQNAKFQLNLPQQTIIATVVFVRSPHCQ